MTTVINIHNMAKLKIRFVCSLFILVFATSAYAAEDEIYTSFFSNAGAGGYDVVAYFTEGKPVKGLDDFNIEHQGAKWYFSSQANLASFKENPETYAPQYGGYCAWAIANGDLASSDPLQWTVHNQKLYLNYDAEIQARWLVDKEMLISKGDLNWPDILK